MKVLIAMDKYKGSLTAVQAGEAVAAALHRAWPEAECTLCPIADGGEGTTDTLIAVLHGERVAVLVHDAQGRLVDANYGMTGDGTAIMEMSVASGLAMVSDLPLDPRTASTAGTGEMMLDAIRRGATRIIIGIGGSATNEAGVGMAQVLGFRFLDDGGMAVDHLPAELERVVAIDPSALRMPEVLVACDVDNPLLGPRGASHVYGPQKGVKDVNEFDERLRRVADLVARDLDCDHRDEPGAGAAGGLGFGLMSFCKAKLVSGFDLVADVTKLEQQIAACDLVITGEGKVDSQTLHGKGPVGVAEMARRHGKPVVAIAGAVEDSPAVRAKFDEAYAVKPTEMPLAEAMRRGAELIQETVVRHAARLRELVL
ncbi:MAG: glycerate kinase [Verrucomicrobiaceae bacterium]|nr:glycerate kinase [Verrucomicrobiaceae bacterium]